MASRKTQIARLSILRGEAPGKYRFRQFEVPFEPGQSILDALRWIRVNEDPTLAIRYSCINANACKECMVKVDGKPTYACTTRLTTTRTKLEPLDNKPRVRDLVTIIAPPDERPENIGMPADDEPSIREP